MNLIFDNQLSIFEDIFYKYLTPKQCTKLYTSNLILYNIYLINNKFEDYYFMPKTDIELNNAVNIWCNNREEAILKYGHISFWNTIKITNMQSIFQKKFYFIDDISDWNTSNVYNMAQMFSYTYNFNQPLNYWNTSNVTNMSYMFCNSTKFNQPLDNWDTSNVFTMYGMFYSTENFFS